MSVFPTGIWMENRKRMKETIISKLLNLLKDTAASPIGIQGLVTLSRKSHE